MPLAGWYFGRCRHIPVKLGDRSSSRRALARVGEALAEGTPVAIFPEGERLPDGMGRFHAGAFVAAQRARVPIVPVLLEGAGGLWQPGSFVVEGRHEIRVAVLDPIAPADFHDSSVDDLSNLVREKILAARIF